MSSENSLNLSAETTKRVRTRYAPSPTGSPHVGNIRTALFSWLLARHFGGDFVLRIEDTDQTRLVPGALNDIIGSLHALGLDYDEGPDVASVAALDHEKYGTVPRERLLEGGGDKGPYFQSMRLPRYQAVIRDLIESGHAYYAFETKEELEGMRAAAEMRKQPFLYDRRYRDYPREAAEARVAKGEAHVVRFKMPIEGVIRTTDALREATDWDATTQDDFIILKADGFPPYHMAVVVDDHDMEISHALRGEEWLSSSPKHFCLFNALGWEPPIFVHVPYVLGPDGKKFSKRTGAKPVTEFMEEGILPEALVNFLSLVGWSPGDDSEVLELEEIIRKFEINGISRSPGIFDMTKLEWMNGVYIRNLTGDELIRRVLPFLQKENLVPAEPNDAERAYIAEVIPLEQERMKRLDEVAELTRFFFPLLPEYQEKSVEKWLKNNSAAVSAYLSDLRDALKETGAPQTEGLSDEPGIEGSVPVWNAAHLETITREIGAKHHRERGELTHPIRVAISGRENGPGLFEMMAVLGMERVLARLNHAVEIARG